MITFRYKDNNRNKKDVEIDYETLVSLVEETAYEILCSCDCESIGESNVVECNCEDKYEDYSLSEVF